MSKTPAINGKVVHSSLRLFSQPDLEFPNSDSRLGICVRVGYDRHNERNMASVYYESPIVSSPGKGDTIEIEEVEGYIRSRALEISTQCRQLSKELLLHAERLEQLSIEDESKLIDNIQDNSLTDSNLPVLDDTQTYILQRKREKQLVHEHNTIKEPSTAKNSSNLSLAEIIRRRAEAAGKK